MIPSRLHWAKKSCMKELIRTQIKLIPRRLALIGVRVLVAWRRQNGSPTVNVPQNLAYRHIEKIPLTVKGD